MAESKPGDAFDVASAVFFLTATWDMNELDWLSLRYEFRDGEVTSTAVPNTRIVDAASAITDDRVFGVNAFAYRIDAKTQVFNLSWSRAVLDAGAINLGIEYQDTRGKNGVDYSVGILRAGFIYSY